MQILKITTNDMPNYPLYVKQGEHWTAGLESMLDGHPIFDRIIPLDVGCSLNINIEVVEMPQEEFEALEPWEP